MSAPAVQLAGHLIQVVPDAAELAAFLDAGDRRRLPRGPRASERRRADIGARALARRRRARHEGVPFGAAHPHPHGAAPALDGRKARRLIGGSFREMGFRLLCSNNLSYYLLSSTVVE